MRHVRRSDADHTLSRIDAVAARPGFADTPSIFPFQRGLVMQLGRAAVLAILMGGAAGAWIAAKRPRPAAVVVKGYLVGDCPVFVQSDMSCPTGWQRYDGRNADLRDYEYQIGPGSLCVPVTPNPMMYCCDNQTLDRDGTTSRFGPAHTPTGNCG